MVEAAERVLCRFDVHDGKSTSISSAGVVDVLVDSVVVGGLLLFTTRGLFGSITSAICVELSVINLFVVATSTIVLKSR